jgi:hypothetical protein
LAVDMVGGEVVGGEVASPIWKFFIEFKNKSTNHSSTYPPTLSTIDHRRIFSIFAPVSNYGQDLFR